MLSALSQTKCQLNRHCEQMVVSDREPQDEAEESPPSVYILPSHNHETAFDWAKKRTALFGLSFSAIVQLVGLWASPGSWCVCN